MYDSETLILSGVIALIVGVALGILFTRRFSADSRKQRELERNVDQLLQQQKDYQHQVVEHFTGTATLLNNLAESYRDVHNHLAKGATALCDDGSGSILRPIPETPIAQITGELDPAAVQPPLDYAPKASPFATGVLNEEFGLDKRAESPEDAAKADEEQPVEAQERKSVAGPDAEAAGDKGPEERGEKKQAEGKSAEGAETAQRQAEAAADEKPPVEEKKAPAAEKKAPAAEKKSKAAKQKEAAKKEKASAA